MGCACLRGHRHPWPAGGAGGAAARGRRQGQLADQPDLAGTDARSELLRAGGDPDAVHHGEPDAVADPNTVALRIGIALGDRRDQRLGQSMPIAHRHRDAVSVAERQREGVELAVARS